MSVQPNYFVVDCSPNITLSVNTPEQEPQYLKECLNPLYEERIEARPNKKKATKEDRDRASRDFHNYFGDLMRGKTLYEEDMRVMIEVGLERCKSTVTTHLLYATDVKGMNRADIFEAAVPILIECKPGFTFFNTLIRGLVRIDAWKSICSLIRDDMSSKVIQFIFETLEYHIKKRNRKCLRGMPRQGRVANRIRGHLKMRPAKWRHVLAGGSRGSITSFMSSNDWSKIEYTKLSVYNLATNYHAFMRHDGHRFRAFLKLYPETSLAMKKCRFSKHKPYPSSKEIFDNYVVPIKDKEHSHEPARY